MKRFGLVVLGLTSSLVACAEGAGAPDGAKLSLSVAPLTLPGVVDACYSVYVRHGDGTPVWEQHGLCASQYGDGQGSIAYVGTCDASEATNVVELVLEDLWADATPGAEPLAPGSDYVNPCTGTEGGPRCVQTVDCVENADTPVVFDLTIMRSARQGFFDIAVNFEDIFCSAKFDTCYTDEEGTADPSQPIVLLHDMDGVRGRTAVLGFACTGGPTASTDPAELTHLYASDIAIYCYDPGAEVDLDTSLAAQGLTPFAVIDPAAGDPGERYTPSAPSPIAGIFQVGVYEGHEDLACGSDGEVALSCDKVYWNAAFGITASGFPAGKTCAAQWSGTASSGELPGGVLPADATYPVIWLSTVLVDGEAQDPVVCQANGLDRDGSHMTTRYAPMAGLEDTVRYPYELTTDGATVDTHSVQFLAHEEPTLHTLLAQIDPTYGRVTSAQSESIAIIGKWSAAVTAWVRNPESGPTPILGITVTQDLISAGYAYYLGAAYIAYARNPEVGASILDSAQVVYDAADPIASDFVQVARLAGLQELFHGIARQPEVEAILSGFSESHVGGMSNGSSELVQVARGWLVGSMLLDFARQPELFMDEAFVGRIVGLIGEAVQPSEKIAAILTPYLKAKVAEATAIQPELGSMFVDFVANLSGVSVTPHMIK